MIEDRAGAAPKANSAPSKELSFFKQLSMMRRAFVASPVRNVILMLCAGLLAIIIGTAVGQIILNRWNQPFYDAIEKRNLSAFFSQLVVFFEIASVLLVLNVSQSFLNQLLHLKLREGLTRDLIGEWMRPKRAFRLGKAGAIGVNPDQRLHEDARHLSDLSADLGIGLVQASILLVSFVGVLWSISANFSFHIQGREIAIPGYMVWAAFIYAGTASCFSWLAGRRLIKLNNERYSREANLRFSLMRVNENVDAISIAGGESDEKRRLELDLQSVLGATRSIIGALVRLTWVTAGYGWVTVIAPVVIAAPIYFAGDLTFGGLMMAAAAFTQVHASLRWFTDNIGGIADWRATLFRVASFRAAMLKTDELNGPEGQIELGRTEDDCMVFDHVEIASSEGRTKLPDEQVVIRAGEKVIVTGGPSTGRSLLFRAMAGLWPRGRGRIGLPTRQPITFVPRSPYIPRGNLRTVLSYPLGLETFDETAFAGALVKVGLGRLSASLDRDVRWDHELNDDDQRLLGFARLLLHKPKWIVINEALDVLQSDARRKILAVFKQDLADSTILDIGQTDRNGGFFTRVVMLSFEPKHTVLRTFPGGRADKQVHAEDGGKNALASGRSIP